MSKEIFIALSGGMAYQRHLEVVANNLANVSTTGFKGDRTVFSVAMPEFESQGRSIPPKGTPAYTLANSYAATATSYTDMSEGGIQVTRQPFDIALEGEGMFSIQAGNETLYTRNGQFHLNKEGLLVTSDNNPVLGEGGPIRLESQDVRIDTDGNVYEGGKKVDTLAIVRFAPEARLKKVGETFFTADGATPIPGANGEVVQGAIERSNVDALRGMLELIQVQRNYESFTKIMTQMDEIDQKTNARVKV